MKNINTKKGFTVIEVVLVLAIAGLIFLMIFVALPNLQKSQRDTQRRNDFSQLAANIQGYMSNNGGNLPETSASLDADTYINKDGNDPYGIPYTLEVEECTGAAGADASSTICTGVTELSNATLE